MSSLPTSGAAPTLQGVVQRLQAFWRAQGCAELTLCDFQISFAALHPDTFFSLLGGQWRAAYLQPVRRPLDGCRGRHPYRLNRHHPFEMVLKPAPRDVMAAAELGPRAIDGSPAPSPAPIAAGGDAPVEPSAPGAAAPQGDRSPRRRKKKT